MCGMQRDPAQPCFVSVPWHCPLCPLSVSVFGAYTTAPHPPSFSRPLSPSLSLTQVTGDGAELQFDAHTLRRCLKPVAPYTFESAPVRHLVQVQWVRSGLGQG